MTKNGSSTFVYEAVTTNGEIRKVVGKKVKKERKPRKDKKAK